MCWSIAGTWREAGVRKNNDEKEPYAKMAGWNVGCDAGRCQ
jgi:hypothetical protein